MSNKHSTPLMTNKTFVSNSSNFSRISASPIPQDKDKSKKLVILKTKYLQTAFLKSNSKQTIKRVEEDAAFQITQIWYFNLKLKNKYYSIEKSVDLLECTIKHQKAIENQENFFNEYVKIKQEINSICDKLFKQIGKQRLYLNSQVFGLNDEKEILGEFVIMLGNNH